MLWDKINAQRCQSGWRLPGLFNKTRKLAVLVNLCYPQFLCRLYGLYIIQGIQELVFLNKQIMSRKQGEIKEIVPGHYKNIIVNFFIFQHKINVPNLAEPRLIGSCPVIYHLDWNFGISRLGPFRKMAVEFVIRYNDYLINIFYF